MNSTGDEPVDHSILSLPKSFPFGDSRSSPWKGGGY